MSALIFISYSRRDEREKDQLVKQLRVLETAGKIEVWSDDRIQPGERWEEAIDSTLQAATAAVLLISADFLTSPFIKDREVPRILQAHAARGLQVFPVIAKPCAWEEIKWLARMQVRPRSLKPIWGSPSKRPAEQLAEITREFAALVRKSAQPPMPMRPLSWDKSAELSLPAQPGVPCSDDCRRAIDVVSLMIQKTREVTLRRIKEIVGTAIKHGAPLYNQDQITDCAHIYSITATSLLRMLRNAASNEPTPKPFAIHASSSQDASFANERLLASVVRTILQAEIEAAGELTVASSNDVAWVLRYCFDEIIGFAHFVEKIEGAMQGVRASTQIAPVLSTALHAAETLQTTASQNGREWILACAGIFRYSATLLVPVLERDRTNRVAGRIANMFAIALKSDDTGANANPYRSAWALHHAVVQAHKLVTR